MVKEEKEKLDKILAEDDSEECNEIVDDEEDEELETVDFDLEKLILEGKDAVMEREIEFFDMEDSKKKKMKVYVKPLSRGDRGDIDKAIADNKNKKGKKNIIDLICALGLCYSKNGEGVGLSEIRALPDGVAKSIADEIKFISGEFTDRFEDKAIQQLFPR